MPRTPATTAAKAPARRGRTPATIPAAAEPQPATAPDGARRPGRVPGGPVKYQQLADTLRAAITGGALRPGAPLPSESQLMAAHGVSRPTARAAIAALRDSGLITVLHGKGAFVRPATDRPAHTHPRTVTTGLAGTYADADTDAAGWRPVDAPARYATTAGPDLALALGVAEHTPVVVYERLLTNDADHRISHRLYLTLATLARLDVDPDAFLTSGEVYAALAAAGHRPGWTDHVRARMPTPDDAVALHIPTATPMLVIRRTTHGTSTTGSGTAGMDGGPVLAVEDSRLSADDAQLAYRIGPAADPSSTQDSQGTARPRRRPQR